MRTTSAILAAVVLCTVLGAATVHAAEDRDPGVKNKHFRAAVELIRKKEYAAAKALFTLALKDHPDSMALLRATGYCCMKLGQLEEATAFYKKVIAIGEKLEDKTAKERERIKVAEKRLKELAALAPRKPEPKRPEPTKKETPKQEQYTFKELEKTLPGDYVWFREDRKIGTMTLFADRRIKNLRGQTMDYRWSIAGNELILQWAATRTVLDTVVRPGVYQGWRDGALIRIEKVGGVDVAALARKRKHANIPADAQKFGGH